MRGTQDDLAKRKDDSPSKQRLLETTCIAAIIFHQYNYNCFTVYKLCACTTFGRFSFHLLGYTGMPKKIGYFFQWQ